MGMNMAEGDVADTLTTDVNTLYDRTLWGREVVRSRSRRSCRRAGRSCRQREDAAGVVWAWVAQGQGVFGAGIASEGRPGTEPKTPRREPVPK